MLVCYVVTGKLYITLLINQNKKDYISGRERTRRVYNMDSLYIISIHVHQEYMSH